MDPQEESAAMAAEPDVESKVLQIWSGTLHVTDLGPDDNFFELGGDSLLATQICARVSRELGVALSVRDVFRAPCVAELVQVIDKERGTPRRSDPPPAAPGAAPGPAGGERTYPLSANQRQMWFLEQMAGHRSAYHVHRTIRVDGAFDPSCFERAAQAVAGRHAGLRTTFEEVDGQVRQVVHERVTVPVESIDLAEVPADARDRRFAEILEAELVRPLDLARPPLMRWTVVRVSATEHRIILLMHHIVVDGWSLALIVRDIETAYNALLDGRSPRWPEPATQYPDFAARQNLTLETGGLDEQRDYWHRQLDGIGGVLALPTDRARPAVQSFSGRMIRIELGGELTEAIRALGRAERTTAFAIAYTAFALLMHRYSGDDDICVGTAFANRGSQRLESLVGMLMNTVALRSRLAGQDTFRDLLARGTETLLDAAAHQEYPFPALVGELLTDRDPSRSPLVQVMFSAHDYVENSPRFGAAVGTIQEQANGSAKMDLNVIMVPRAKSQLGSDDVPDDRIVMLWEYNRDLFGERTVRRMAEAYRVLLADALRRPGAPANRLRLVTDQDREHLVSGPNSAVRQAVGSGTPLVADLVAGHAARTPGAIAVREEERALTYGQLESRADRLADALTALGAGPDRVVGIRLPRGIDLVVAELAVFKTGAAIQPMDPAHPAERVAYMLAESRVTALVTAADDTAGAPAHVPVVSVDDPGLSGPADAGAPARAAGPAEGHHLAYVVYTSGSTGRPKGVMVEHYQFANLAAWHRSRFGLTQGSRTTLVASPGFDFSLWEVWPTLTAGGQVHIPGTGTLLSAEELQRWLLEREIEVSLLPTALGIRLLDLPWPARTPLRKLCLGGEQLTRRPAPTLPFELVNAYGPTEITAIATTGDVAPASPDDDGPPSIGGPVDGAALYVLDPEMEPVPCGVTGELYIGGVGVGRGYVARPDLTAERFVPDPFGRVPGGRLYRTGDLVRMRQDGTIDFVGRADSQVKLRGYRVELGEIGSVLRGHPAVGDVHVMVRTAPGTGEQRLAAYVVPAAGERPDPEHLRRFLERSLPAYMIPGSFTALDRLPLTRNGKVDWRALPDPAERAPRTGPAAPSEGTEARIAAVWCEVLGLRQVGRDDNFFDCGGHSLLLADVRTRLRTLFGRDIPIVKLFEFVTIRALAAHLEGPPTPAARDERAPAGGSRRRTAARAVTARAQQTRRPSRP